MAAPRSEGQLLLEFLQQKMYSHLGRLDEFGPQQSDVFDDEKEVARSIEEMLAKRAALVTPEELATLRTSLPAKIQRDRAMDLPTRFERRDDYLWMRYLADEIEAAAQDLGMRIPVRPLLGTLPTGWPNGQSRWVGAEYIVMFDSELFGFGLLLSQVVVLLMPLTRGNKGQFSFSNDLSKIEASIDEKPELVQRFCEVVLAYLMRGAPSALTPPYELEEPYNSMAEVLHRSMALFLMAHEYGHIILGHHPNTGQLQGLFNSVLATSALDSSGEQKEMFRSWFQEHEADARALTLTIRAMQLKGHDVAFSYWGVDFFLSCIDIIEKGVALVRAGEESVNGSSDTHPSTQLRRGIVRDTLRGVLRRNGLSEGAAEAPIELGSCLEKTIAKLWARLRPVLVGLHKEGRTVSPIWP
jgi:hypothetical protein